MIFSYNWIKEYFKEDLPSADKITDLLTKHSFEIESLEEKNNDYLIDIDVLPNRAHDALCHYGMAKEISAITGLKLKEISASSKTEIINDLKHAEIEIKVEGDFCRRYIGKEIKNIKVDESPDELKEKLDSIGQRSINNIVDITNIVMFELNQPMHAFDKDKVSECIIVRFARDAEKITTLDNNDIDLDKSIPLIADESGPLAIAGVKGGKKAEVDETTTNIILESANFDPILTRKTSQKIGIQTDSSKRFENEITPELAQKAIDRAVELIEKYASTNETEILESVDYYPEPVELKKVEVSIEKLNSLLGLELKESDISLVFDKLDFKYEIKKESIFEVEIPSERLDLNIPVDLIEEVGRIYGYDKVPEQEIPKLDFEPKINKEYGLNYLIRKIMIELGFSEVMTYSFVSNGDLMPVKPIADDKKYLRSSLREGLEKSLNLNQKNADWLGLDHIKIFEIGKVFVGKENDYKEKLVLGIGVINKQGIKKPKPAEFIKQAAEKISEELCINIDIKINEQEETFAEIDLDNLYKDVDIDKVLENKYPEFDLPKNQKYQIISQYPFVLRDIAVWLPNETKPEELVDLIKQNSGELLVKEPRQFDVYEKDDETSYAYRLVFQSYEKTLTDQEVNQIMDKINSEIEKRGWKIR